MQTSRYLSEEFHAMILYFPKIETTRLWNLQNKFVEQENQHELKLKLVIMPDMSNHVSYLLVLSKILFEKITVF